MVNHTLNATHQEHIVCKKKGQQTAIRVDVDAHKGLPVKHWQRYARVYNLIRRSMITRVSTTRVVSI